MPNWVRDQKEWATKVPGEKEETKLWVSGVMDRDDLERPKLVLADHPENNGKSIVSDEATTAAVKSLSASMKIEPREADWYVQREDGKLFSVAMGKQTVLTEDPALTAIKTRNDEPIQDLEKLEKIYPPIESKELKATLKEPRASHLDELSEAYTAARLQEYGSQEAAAGTDKKTALASARDYDLSQESIRRPEPSY